VKRAAEEQISEHTDFDVLNETDENVAGAWTPAAPEVLATRKIRKLKRPNREEAVPGVTATGDQKDLSIQKVSNPFGGVSLVPPDASKKQPLPPIATDLSSRELSSPQKSANSVSSGGLSISIPSPSTGALPNGPTSRDKFGSFSPAHSGKAHQLTPGSFTPGGGRKVNPFSGQSPHANPFANVQDEGNKNNDMWTKLNSVNNNQAPAVIVDGTVAPQSLTGSAVTSSSSSSSAETTVEEDILNKISNSKRLGSEGKAKVADNTPTTATAVLSKLPPVAAPVANPFSAAASTTATVTRNPFCPIPPSSGFASSAKAAETGESVPVGPFSSAAGAGSIFGKSAGGSSSFLSSIGTVKVGAVFGASSGSSGNDNAFLAATDTGAKAAVKDSFNKDDDTQTGAFTGAGADKADTAAEDDEEDSVQAAALEAQSEKETASAVYGKTYAMVGGPLLTGEEGETCLLQVRAKLFKLVTKVPEKPDSDEEDNSNDADAGKKKTTAAAAVAAASGPATTQVKEWSEVGVGPLRILQAKDGGATGAARIVMRREERKGGAGTKVILNAKIKAYSSAVVQGEKAMCFSTLVPVDLEEECAFVPPGVAPAPAPAPAPAVAEGGGVEAVSYMMRCKLASETSDLHKVVTTVIASEKKQE